jgi:hypothetical protein
MIGPRISPTRRARDDTPDAHAERREYQSHHNDGHDPEQEHDADVPAAATAAHPAANRSLPNALVA